MFLGLQTATLIAKWLIDEKIMVSHLNFKNNNLEDKGALALAMAISMSSTIVSVDLTQNQLSPRCA